MPECTLSPYWGSILTSLLPPAAALLSAIALWVASRARGTSVDAQSTSQAAVTLSLLHAEPPSRSESPHTAPVQKKP